MTLIKLRDEDEPEEDAPQPTKIPISFPSDEEWEAKYGDWRYLCDECGASYPLKEWTGFGLAVKDFNSLSSADVNVWEKLLDGDAHFCGPRCAGMYFLNKIGRYMIQIDFE